MVVHGALTRRQVLRYGMGGGLLLAAGRAVAPTGAVSPMRVAHEFEEATIAGLRREMRRGRLTSEELTQWYLDRIDQLNPLLHAVIETNPDALGSLGVAIASARRGTRPAAVARHPCHRQGQHRHRDQMQTGAGSLALVGAECPDAPIVARLREAGAIVLGKTNLSEWANFRGFAPFNGWSARGGFTRNPYVLDLDPCGSSSGSAIGGRCQPR